jgi:cell division protein ZapA (FtsZ GTPase activity inhibitor)
MEDLSIKLNIANRSYPLTIKAEQEEYFRKAAVLITDRMKVYEANYSVKDHQDLLAMCALEFASKFLEVENRRSAINESVSDQLEEMEKFISQYLSQY